MNLGTNVYDNAALVNKCTSEGVGVWTLVMASDLTILAFCHELWLVDNKCTTLLACFWIKFILKFCVELSEALQKI
jgi:hypothetical protein